MICLGIHWLDFHEILDLHGAQMINPNDFGDAVISPLGILLLIGWIAFAFSTNSDVPPWDELQ